MRLALVLLLIGATRHYGWALWRDTLRGSASKMLGALAALCLIGLVVYLAQSRVILLPAAWYAFEELQTAICSAAYMVTPWTVPVGMSICSAKIDFDIAAVSVLLLALLLWHPVRSSYVQNKNEVRK